MGLQEERDRWEQQTVRPVTAKNPERDGGQLETVSGIPLRRLYLPTDTSLGGRTEVESYKQELGFPGEPPFTRGVQPTMYRGRYWTMRQYAGFGSAKETNERFRYLLDQGQTGLSVAFDLPTQIGYDSDHPLARGEVGKVGVAIDSLADMEVLFENIPLDKVSTSMTINAPAAIILAMYIVVAEKQGVNRALLRGTIQNDILKEYMARGTYMFPPAPSMRLIADTFRYCSNEMPRWNSISISGYHIREAGATAVQELGYTLANAIAYVETALESGLDIDEFAGRLSFFFSAGSDLLEEVAKFRAARRMWARISAERFGAQKQRSRELRFHAQTSGAMLTAQQADINISRVTLHALAAILGGAQSLHTNSRDEALGLPSEDSVRIALRTQQVIALESGIGGTVDPLGGSYAIEALTDEIARGASELIDRIAEYGGMVRAIEDGVVQSAIEDAAYKYQCDVDSGKRPVVGVNCHRIDDDASPLPLTQSVGVGERRSRETGRIRVERDGGEVDRCLTELEIAALNDDAPLMEPIIEAVRAYATLGEISDVLRSVFGEYDRQVGR